MIFTVFDPAARRVRYCCESSVAPDAPHLAGVSSDPATQRMREDLLGVEPKTEVEVVLGPLPVAPEAPLLVTLGAPCRVVVDGEAIATLAAGATSIAFPSAGTYRVTFVPVEDALYLPALLEVEVAGVPAPALADRVAPELEGALQQRLSNLLDRIEVLAQHAVTGGAFVDEIRARPMTNAAEIRAALKDLGLAVSKSFEESAEQMRAMRKSVMVVREFMRRTGRQ